MNLPMPATFADERERIRQTRDWWRCVEYKDGYVYFLPIEGVLFDRFFLSSLADGPEIYASVGPRYELSHVLGTSLIGIADKEAKGPRQRPISRDLSGYEVRAPFPKSCKEAPAGKSCVEFSDGYRWLVGEDSIYQEAVAEAAGRAKIAVVSGCFHDYYHVLNTRLIRVAPVILPMPRPSEPPQRLR
jgi:hypothetical protein